MADVERGDELPLLDVHDSAGSPSLDEKVGLAAEESRNLENIGRLGGERGLRRFVNVSENGEARVAHALQNPQAFLQSRAAVGAGT